ncbi:MAG: hypothetical protein M1827_000665 [Pycnora praestabilis]|nr:MAG: hypothetical protein M1827_000665 [Pycnora praestabilis]
MAASTRPKLPSLKTPTSANFPSLKTPISATPLSASLPSELPRSPLPGFAGFIKQEDGMKTPITPPSAYTDFLKALSPASLSPFPSDKSGKSSPLSQPSTASSSCSCNCDQHQSPKSAVPSSPFVHPMSAPAHPTRRLRVPQSPAFSPSADSPMSAHSVRSPFSIRSPNEWDLDGKAKYFDPPRTGNNRPVSVRQVVTRTVTYTRTNLEPAPKGKRRKIE